MCISITDDHFICWFFCQPRYSDRPIPLSLNAYTICWSTRMCHIDSQILPILKLPTCLYSYHHMELSSFKVSSFHSFSSQITVLWCILSMVSVSQYYRYSQDNTFTSELHSINSLQFFICPCNVLWLVCKLDKFWFSCLMCQCFGVGFMVMVLLCATYHSTSDVSYSLRTGMNHLTGQIRSHGRPSWGCGWYGGAAVGSSCQHELVSQFRLHLVALHVTRLRVK
jgi:hypothetical protein